MKLIATLGHFYHGMSCNHLNKSTIQDTKIREGKAMCTLQYPSIVQLYGEKQEAKTGRVAIKVLIMNTKRKFETIQGVNALWV